MVYVLDDNGFLCKLTNLLLVQKCAMHIAYPTRPIDFLSQSEVGLERPLNPASTKFHLTDQL